MKIKNVLVVHKMGYSPEEKKTVDHVQEILKKKNILWRSISRLEVHHEIVKGRDLIIVVGGDGTFLKTAQFVSDETPFLCVNADPKNTEGFYSKTERTSFEKKLDAILRNKIKPKRLWRLLATINGKQLEPCLNEYYIGQQKPYDVARYVLTVNGKQEEQKSSGLLVCTASGSSAWCRGAGGTLLRMDQKKLQYVVREPYVGTLLKTRMKKGVLPEKVHVQIIAKTEGMIVVPDAVGKEHHIENKGVVDVKIYEHPTLLFY
ncbi:MAG: NAD(+)/NADH kinase [Nanoarchaeota archaeon]